MTEKVFKELMARLEEASVNFQIHKSDVWLAQLEKSRESLLKAFKEQQKEIEDWKQDLDMYQEYLDREKNRSELLNERCKRYEETMEKIVEMESPFYHRENQLETPYNYARVSLERNNPICRFKNK